MIEICDKKKCTGCGACQNICPKKCIVMKPSSEGFLYPCIDDNSCVNCHSCQRVCPVNNPLVENTKAYFYYGWHKDQSVLEKSSSGGFFTALASYVLQMNGVVFGVYKDTETNNLYFGHIEDIKDISLFRFSKYYQAESGNTYSIVKDFLNAKRYVLFTGVACQIAGLLSYLKDNKNLDYLITADVLCHGTPSKLAVERYIFDKEQEKNKRIIDFKFRVKPDDCRWNNGGSARMKLFFEDGTSEVMNPVLDTYFSAFTNNLILRESCYVCQYCGTSRISDFTMADYWGAEEVDAFHQHYGISLILCNSEKSRVILPQINELIYEKANEKTAIENNLALKHPNLRPNCRNFVYKMIINIGFDRAIKIIYAKKYVLACVKRLIGFRSVEKIKRALNR